MNKRIEVVLRQKEERSRINFCNQYIGSRTDGTG